MPPDRILAQRCITRTDHGYGLRRRSPVSRAALIATSFLALLAGPLAAGAQPPANAPRVGVLLLSTPAATSHLREALSQGLRDLGYMEGQNIAIEYRWAEGRLERLPQLAQELVRLKVDVVVTTLTPGIRAAQQATKTIPIVMAVSGDPAGSGLVQSLARPGGNITGLSSNFRKLSGTALEILKEAVPGVSRVAVLWNPAIPDSTLAFREMRAGGETLKLELLSVEVRGLIEFENSFLRISREHAGALIVLPENPLFFTYRRQLVDLAARHRLPAIYLLREFVDAGGLMAYGISLPEMFRRAASYVDKILKGAKPADLPVEQAAKFELVINLKTAKALGLTIPQSILLRADQVLQ